MRSTAPQETRRPHLEVLVGGATDVAGQRVVTGGERGAEERRQLLAGEVASLLASATEGEIARAPLALPLALSACMARHCVDPEGLIDAMLPLRGALIAVSDLDAASEPVPLPAGEPKAAALGLAAYLHGLLSRASAGSDLHREALASAAAAQLRSA